MYIVTLCTIFLLNLYVMCHKAINCINFYHSVILDSLYLIFTFFLVIEAPLLRSVSPTEDSIVVSWDPVDRAILYTLDLIKEGSDSQVQVNTLQTNMTFRNLDPGVVYCIRARAWDPNNFPGDEITIYQITRKFLVHKRIFIYVIRENSQLVSHSNNVSYTLKRKPQYLQQKNNDRGGVSLFYYMCYIS